MKKILNSIRNKFAFFCVAMLSAVYSFAQDAADQSGSIYDVKPAKHVFNVYSMSFEYILFGVVVIFLGYVGYRYMHDHADEEDDVSHEPHHQ